ncbi:MAG: right-handed parallel beta-helix repeat-containing protein, partial [Ignavibacteria bacterium]|nr:right-handed parallel beta-helix repeat-containing protein [Ignavibacteria bacterium]
MLLLFRTPLFYRKNIFHLFLQTRRTNTDFFVCVCPTFTAMFFFNFKTVNLQRKFSLDASSVNVLKTVGVNGDFATIRQAFDSVNAGAFSNVLVLSLLDSQYNEPPLFLSPSETAPTSVILKPAGVFIPTITINQSTPADTIGIFFENIRQIILLNLHLETQNALWNSALCVSEGVSVVRLDTISLNGGTAITGIEAEITEDNSALIFRACKIYNVKSGISVRGWPAFTLLHSEINHNEGAGIFLEMGFGRVRIIGNTLIGNDAADAGIVGSVYSPFCVIDSNTISNYQVSGIAMEEIDGSSFVSKNMFHKKSSNGKQRLEQLKTNIANSFSKKLPTRNERLQHFKSRKKHLQKRTQKNSAASSLFAIRNNTITFLIGEAGISALSVYESEVDISHNSITNQYGADVGIYGGSLEEVPSVAIEQNFIRNVANGIFVDIIYTSEDVGSGTVNINSNNIESGNNGLYFPDVICRHASMSMNTVRAVTEKTRERRSPTQQNTFTGDIGIFTQMEGVLEADSNSIEGFASAF